MNNLDWSQDRVFVGHLSLKVSMSFPYRSKKKEEQNWKLIFGVHIHIYA